MSTKRQRLIEAYQQRLFEPRVQTPNWDALAPEVRETVTGLFAQMLTAHWESEEDRDSTEVTADE